MTDRWNRLSVACVGIARWEPAPGQVVYLGEANVSQYLAREPWRHRSPAISRSQGQPAFHAQDDRISASVSNSCARAQTIVAVAGGIEKTQAVLGALRTRLITDLFLDQVLAQAVLGEFK